MLSSFPAWNSQGVIPPIDPQNAVSSNRSPYVVSLVDFVRHFARSPERIVILRGFLDYRAELHAIGLSEGFQWLNGSFLEHKERRLGAPPGDIDVVTFFHLPANTTQSDVLNRNPSLFDHDDVKEKFRVDSYFESLANPPEQLIVRSNYWYGMWSHQRDTFLWKGFFQVSFSSGEDSGALAVLSGLSGGATP